MKTIEITEISPSSFSVTINSVHPTTHQVSVDEDYALKLTQGKISNLALIQLSFEFLLEREPNTSILRSFELSVIGRYFPEYKREIQKRL